MVRGLEISIEEIPFFDIALSGKLKISYRQCYHAFILYITEQTEPNLNPDFNRPHQARRIYQGLHQFRAGSMDIMSNQCNADRAIRNGNLRQ